MSTGKLGKAAPTAAVEDINEFLARDAEKDLLRFLTAGSVDDGKSTLIGRLLYDTKGIYEDQLASIQQSKLNRSTAAFDLSLLTDGLRAEREQGITIDVAYRYFSTARRKFIIADAPGHEQYTRNMVTGASNSELTIVLLDARKGVLDQTRRHAYLSALVGVSHVILAVNKMDLAGFDEQVFQRHCDEFLQFAASVGLPEVTAIPISALEGDNVVEGSHRMPWYKGPTLLEKLETVPVGQAAREEAFRFPVQYVIRPHDGFRGYAGRIASGHLRPGDEVVALPSGQRTRVRTITTFDGDLPEAIAPLSVTVTLEDELDISRGEMLASPQAPPESARKFQAMLVWMQPQPLVAGRTYLLKHTTQQVQARLITIHHRVDIHTLEPVQAESLKMNDIAYVTVETSRPLQFDAYRDNRHTGSFILIDPIGDNTMAAGMIAGEASHKVQADRTETVSGLGSVRPEERRARLGHPPAAVVLSGREGVAVALERVLFERRYLAKHVEKLPPGVTPEAAAKLLYEAGLIAIFNLPAGRDFDAKAAGIPAWHLLDETHLGLPADDCQSVATLLRLLETASVLDDARAPVVTPGPEDLDYAEGI